MSHSRHTRRFPQVLIASLRGALQTIKPGHYSHTHTQTQTNENNAHTHILTPSHTHTLTLSRTGKDTETQTHGHRHTETNTHTHRETNTHTHENEPLPLIFLMPFYMCCLPIPRSAGVAASQTSWKAGLKPLWPNATACVKGRWRNFGGAAIATRRTATKTINLFS